MAEPKRPVTDVRLEVGSEFSATVLMASGFVLADGVELRERYRIESTLGKGGMGQVFAVSIQGGPEAQRYALKVVARPEDHNRDGIIDDEERAAAQTQLDVFARLLRKEAIKQEVVQRHGVSVARMVALVRLDDGSLGMRMELAHGVALEELLEDEFSNKSRTPDVRFAVTVARKLLGQLRRLHELTEAGTPQGFIHSDIKPANIFVDARDRVDPHVTLLDFGVAIAGQLMAQDLASTVGKRTTFLLDQSGGTIGYAPPHHFTSKPTPLSDVFATIVILYELVTVDWPWDAAGMRKNAVNLFRLESLMVQSPRPVREVRASVLPSDAAVLDEFFRAAFARLVSLADRVADALGSGDRAEVDALVPTLRSLAGEFQTKLDRVAAALGGEAREGVVDTAPLAPTARPPRAPEPSVSEGVTASSSVETVVGVVAKPDRSSSAQPRARKPSGWTVLFALALAGAAGVAIGAQRPWSTAIERDPQGIGTFYDPRDSVDAMIESGSDAPSTPAAHATRHGQTVDARSTIDVDSSRPNDVRTVDARALVADEGAPPDALSRSDASAMDASAMDASLSARRDGGSDAATRDAGTPSAHANNVNARTPNVRTGRTTQRATPRGNQRTTQRGGRTTNRTNRRPGGRR